MNHLNIVEAEHDRQPPTGAAENNLAFLLRVLKALPTESDGTRAGLHRKDAGENIAWYAPGGVNVGVSRIMYPSGALVKIISDAGPGGTNGAAWNEEDPIDPARYVFTGGSPSDDGPTPAPSDSPPAPPPVPIDAIGREEFAGLQQRVDEIETAAQRRVDAVEANLRAKIEGLAELVDRSPAELVVEGTTGRSFGHAHTVHLKARRS